MPRINLAELAEQSFGISLEQLDDHRIYKLLAKLVQERSAACPLNNGKKKLYYISAEFFDWQTAHQQHDRPWHLCRG